MKIVAKVLLKLLTIALGAAGIGVIIISLPIANEITKSIASGKLVNAMIELIVLMFTWCIGFAMSIFAIITLQKGFIDDI